MSNPLVAPVVEWFNEAWRPLPWRTPEVTAWGVFVSEMMSHQTPVARVAPVWLEWMERWPTPAALAAESTAEVLRTWGRLGYPRRALRLHESAKAMVAEFDAQVPTTLDDLVSLPGVGPYTAAAVASFAHGHRVAVIDVNIRRVLTRAVTGEAQPSGTLSAVEQGLAEALLPDDPSLASRWNAAVMELGALICTKTPACARCPILNQCAWVGAGRPEHAGAPARVQAWHGTDRQVRGRIVQLLRESAEPVELSGLSEVDADQFRRCLESLVDDGLIIETDDRRLSFPL